MFYFYNDSSLRKLRSCELYTLLILVLEDGLSKNFVNAEVRVVECPDLTLEPFDLAAKG